MAKHMVQCFYCGEKFDANTEPFEMANSRRYAHKACYDKVIEEEDQKTRDKRELEAYIKKLFGYGVIPPKITKQIQTYTHQYSYTYDGMLKALKYFFEVQHGSLDKANGGIGIVPYIYEQSRNYYAPILEAQKKNSKTSEEDLMIQKREIRITPPIREPMRHTRKLFAFLDEEVNSE